MEDSYQSDDEVQELNFAEMSTTKMGDTSVKYFPDPCTILGNGLTANVYPGYHFGINKPAAVKFIKKQYVKGGNAQANELKIWSEIDQNINIVRLYDSYHDPRNGLFLAMEKAQRTFKKQIIQFYPSRDDVVGWLYQISQAVEYLHGKRVIHRDIKPDNILMFSQDENKTVAKLADFGVSKMMSSAEITGTFSNANGTLLWMAPEALTNQTQKFKNTKMLDIFALGMTFYFGLSKGGHPFFLSPSQVDPASLFSEMTRHHLFPDKLSTDQHAANHLVSEMLERDPEKRPGISDVLGHCLFWNWEKQHQFLIRVAICLNNADCKYIRMIKDSIDYDYKEYSRKLNHGKPFNWIKTAKENNFDIVDLLFTSKKRNKPTLEYGNGESVTKFLKLFRDKYVHYPDMKEGVAVVFSDNDGTFCEEMYVKILTSVCPGLTSVLYQNLSLHTNVNSLMPLSKIYFVRKLRNSENKTEVAEGTRAKIRQPTAYTPILVDFDPDLTKFGEFDDITIWNDEIDRSESSDTDRVDIEEELYRESVKNEYETTWKRKYIDAIFD